MTYTYVTTTYAQVKAKATRHGTCSVCGKRTTRSRTFTQTISPFNKVADRSRPKTPAEVQQAVDKQARTWDPPLETFDHDACTEAAS